MLCMKCLSVWPLHLYPMQRRVHLRTKQFLFLLLICLGFTVCGFAQNNNYHQARAHTTVPDKQVRMPGNKADIHSVPTDPGKRSAIPTWVPRNKDGTPDKRLKLHYPHHSNAVN